MKNFKTLFSLALVCAFSITVAYGQSDLLNEGFSKSVPADWTIDDTYFGNNDNGLYDGNSSVKMKPTTTNITTSIYNSAEQFSFYFMPKASDDDASNANSTILIQKSTDEGATWIDVHTTTITTEQAGADKKTWFKDSCDINEASVMLKISSTPAANLYLDDFRLTATPATSDNADIDSIKINGAALTLEAGQTDYSVDLYYVSEATVSAAAVSASATISIVQASNIFSGVEADRTAVISVKSEDETVTTDYNVVMNINMDTVVNESFSSSVQEFYVTDGGYITGTPKDEQNTLPAGDASFSFTATYLELIAVENAVKLTFNAALRKDMGDVFDVKLYKKTGGDSTLLTTISVSDLTTTEWKSYSFDIDESAATSFKFISSQTSENKTRMFIDDVVITRDVTAGISASKEFKNLEVYPNPAQNVLNISGVSGDFAVSVYSLQGSVLISTSNQNAIDISALATGSYLVKVNGDENVSVKKIMVK